MRDPLGLLSWLELKPVKYGRLLSPRVTAIVGKVTFTRNKIRTAISIDIGQFKCMRLRKLRGNFVLLIGDPPVLAFKLLMPPDPIFMCRRCNYIIKLVFVDIQHNHMGTILS